MISPPPARLTAPAPPPAPPPAAAPPAGQNQKAVDTPEWKDVDVGPPEI